MASRTSSARIRMILAVAATALLFADRGQGDEKPSYEIRSLQAHYYYQGSGRFGSSDLFDPSQVLRNGIIGAGSAEEPSNVALVLVTLSGSFLADTKGAVQLDARSKRGEFPRQKIALDTLFSETGTVVAPFLIYDLGCLPLTLSAQLVGVPGNPAPVTRTIPFECGE